MRAHATARIAVVALLGLCLLATVAAPAAAGPVEQSSDATAEPEAAENATDASPGSALAGALVRHEARVGGSLQAAVLEADLQNAASNQSRARRLAAFEEMLDTVVADLRTEHAAVDPEPDERVDRRQRVPSTQARAVATSALAEHANDTARSIPENATASSGLDPDAFDRHARESESIARNGSDDDRRNRSHDEFVLTGSPHDWRDGQYGSDDRGPGAEDSHESSWHSGWQSPWTGHGHGWDDFDGDESDWTGDDGETDGDRQGGHDAGEPHATDGDWYGGTAEQDGSANEFDDDAFENRSGQPEYQSEPQDGWNEDGDGWDHDANGWSEGGEDGFYHDGTHDGSDDGQFDEGWSHDGSTSDGGPTDDSTSHESTDDHWQDGDTTNDGWETDDSTNDGWQDEATTDDGREEGGHSTADDWDHGGQTDDDADAFDDGWSDHDGDSSAETHDDWSDGDDFDDGW